MRFLLGLTKAAALEYAPHHIRINAVCPAFIDTPMLVRAGLTTDAVKRTAMETLHPMGRLGYAEEVAGPPYGSPLPTRHLLPATPADRRWLRRSVA
jgi:NAD(P)-dependent dehydrogenase (short-subunit alcohol dehydrogenase family)